MSIRTGAQYLAGLKAPREVWIDGQRITDPQHQLALGGPYLIRAGSKNRRFAYVVVTPTT